MSKQYNLKRHFDFKQDNTVVVEIKSFLSDKSSDSDYNNCLLRALDELMFVASLAEDRNGRFYKIDESRSLGSNYVSCKAVFKFNSIFDFHIFYADILEYIKVLEE